MTALERAVMTPILFYDLFDRPIRPHTVRSLVYKRRVSDEEFDSTLTSLENQGYIVRRAGFVRLSGRPGLIQNAVVRKNISAQLWRDAEAVIGKLAKIPFVEMIAVVNSLSFDNASYDSDIDLLVITQPGYMAVARDHITLSLKRWGRHNGRGPKRGKVAPDVYLDTERLAIEDFHLGPRDIYFDFWFARLTPVLNRNNAYERFLHANPWIHDVFPHFAPQTKHLITTSPVRELRRQTWETWYRSMPGRAIARWMEESQTDRLAAYQRTVGDRGLVVVQPHVLRFHIPDRRPEYEQRFIERWQTLDLSRS